MGISGIWQWVIVLVIVLLLFGTKRLSNIGTDMGKAIKGFRKGLQHDETAAAAEETTASKSQADPAVDEQPAAQSKSD